ncbi:MAG: ribonuclease [Firmicutes bacterium]|nr:ribonuclease [Bacillota bacterium]
MKNKKRIALWLFIVLLIGILAGCRFVGADLSAPTAVDPDAGETGQSSTVLLPDGQPDANPADSGETDISEDGQYDSKEEVARYINAYGHLPSNYVTKKEARQEGWSGGSLEDCFPGCSIGGDVFQNREGLLPKASGRIYYECDVDAGGRDSRGAKRIVYSNDGLIYYSDDHYDSFTLLYGKEN